MSHGHIPSCPPPLLDTRMTPYILIGWLMGFASGVALMELVMVLV